MLRLSTAELAGPHLHIDVAVVLSGLDIISALLILPQHCETEVLDKISELLSGGNPASGVLVVAVISVVLPTIANNACKATTTIIWRQKYINVSLLSFNTIPQSMIYICAAHDFYIYISCLTLDRKLRKDPVLLSIISLKNELFFKAAVVISQNKTQRTNASILFTEF